MSRDDRYARQIAVPGVGDEGQAAIRRARVHVEGRALDSETCARYLAGAGVRRLEVDPTFVDRCTAANRDVEVVGRAGGGALDVTLYLEGQPPLGAPAAVLTELDPVYRGSRAARWVLARILEQALSM